MWPVVNRWQYGVDPLRELNRLHREVSRLFDDGVRGTGDFPPLNVWGNADEVRVAAEVPGVDPAKMEITVSGNTLTLEGERPTETLDEQDVVYRCERSSGRFVRSIRLPFEVNNDAIQARYENGVLKVSLPRSESTKPRKIQVQS